MNYDHEPSDWQYIRDSVLLFMVIAMNTVFWILGPVAMGIGR